MHTLIVVGPQSLNHALLILLKAGMLMISDLSQHDALERQFGHDALGER